MSQQLVHQFSEVGQAGAKRFEDGRYFVLAFKEQMKDHLLIYPLVFGSPQEAIDLLKLSIFINSVLVIKAFTLR